MSLTRKDYVAVASVLDKEMVRMWPNTIAMQSVEAIAEALADVFGKDNPRFDRSTFFSAASVRCYGCRDYGHAASAPCEETDD